MSITFIAALYETSIRYKKSVGYHCEERKRKITKICRLCEIIVPVFGGFTLKCAHTTSMDPGYMSVGVTQTCFIIDL